GALFEESPEVGLHVDQYGRSVFVCLLEQEGEVGVVRPHRAGVVEVAEVSRALVGAGRRLRLEQLIVDEYGDVLVFTRVSHVVGSEGSTRAVPGLPATARIGPSGQVLIAVLPGHAAGRHPTEIGGAVLEPEVQTVRRDGC